MLLPWVQAAAAVELSLESDVQHLDLEDPWPPPENTLVVAVVPDVASRTCV